MTIEQKFATLNKIQLVMDKCKTYPHVLKQIADTAWRFKFAGIFYLRRPIGRISIIDQGW